MEICFSASVVTCNWTPTTWKKEKQSQRGSSWTLQRKESADRKRCVGAPKKYLLCRLIFIKITHLNYRIYWYSIYSFFKKHKNKPLTKQRNNTNTPTKSHVRLGKLGDLNKRKFAVQWRKKRWNRLPYGTARVLPNLNVLRYCSCVNA